MSSAISEITVKNIPQIQENMQGCIYQEENKLRKRVEIDEGNDSVEKYGRYI